MKTVLRIAGWLGIVGIIVGSAVLDRNARVNTYTQGCVDGFAGAIQLRAHQQLAPAFVEVLTEQCRAQAESKL